MNIKREQLRIIFEFKDKEEQEYWKKRFAYFAKELEDDFKTLLKPIEEAKELKNTEHRYNIAKNGIDELMDLYYPKVR